MGFPALATVSIAQGNLPPVPVSGPLTDTQLRATPVPTTALTDAQLRATPVPVSIPAGFAAADQGNPNAGGALAWPVADSPLATLVNSVRDDVRTNWLFVRDAPINGTLILAGSRTTAGTLLTIPARGLWDGFIQIAGSVRAVVGGAATDYRISVTWTPGTGGTPAYTAAELDLAISNNLVGSGGENCAGSTSVRVNLYAGTTAGTLALVLTGAPQSAFASANGSTA